MTAEIGRAVIALAIVKEGSYRGSCIVELLLIVCFVCEGVLALPRVFAELNRSWWFLLLVGILGKPHGDLLRILVHVLAFALVLIRSLGHRDLLMHLLLLLFFPLVLEEHS